MCPAAGLGADPPSSDPLIAFGWSPRVAALAATSIEYLRAEEPEVVFEPGRVVRVDRGMSIVQTRVAAEPFAVATDQGARADEVPVVGDWLVLAIDGDRHPVIADLLPRWSTITRGDPSGSGEQTLVADVDVVVVVHGLDRPLKPGRIERYLVMAWESGATPVVALTKADLLEDTAEVDAVLAQVSGGVDIIRTSATRAQGLDAIRALVSEGRTMVLFGESGAGKSTLVNALVGEDIQATGDVREGDSKGRHTTTRREMIVCPGGGVIIDTPGLRSLALSELGDGIDLAFPEIVELSTQCRFRDCQHRKEPGCAVRAAVATGSLDGARVERYLALQDEVEDAAAQAEAARERKREGRIASKSLRQHYRIKPN
jgi:ribosome biogenesis GTPase